MIKPAKICLMTNLIIIAYLNYLCFKNCTFYLIQLYIQLKTSLVKGNLMIKVYYLTIDVWSTFNII